MMFSLDRERVRWEQMGYWACQNGSISRYSSHHTPSQTTQNPKKTLHYVKEISPSSKHPPSRECYEFERAFFTLKCFLPSATSRHVRFAFVQDVKKEKRCYDRYLSQEEFR